MFLKNKVYFVNGSGITNHEVVFRNKVVMQLQLFEKAMMINNKMFQTNGHALCNE